MNYFSTMTSKGQLTVPQEIRKRLGLQTGDRVEFVVEEDRTVIRPAREEANPFEKFIGGGSAKRFPADFIIAAHAQLKADRLMTRDAKRYSLDFPNLRLI